MDNAHAYVDNKIVYHLILRTRAMNLISCDSFLLLKIIHVLLCVAFQFQNCNFWWPSKFGHIWFFVKRPTLRQSKSKESFSVESAPFSFAFFYNKSFNILIRIFPSCAQKRPCLDMCNRRSNLTDQAYLSVSSPPSWNCHVLCARMPNSWWVQDVHLVLDLYTQALFVATLPRYITIVPKEIPS